ATIVIRCAGTYNIQVANPQPGGGLSNAAQLNVPSTASPQSITNQGVPAVVTNIQNVPSAVANLTGTISVDAGAVSWNPYSPPFTSINQAVVITGSNFSLDAVAWYTSPCDKLGLRQAPATTRESDTRIVATIPVECAGTYNIQVGSPQA